MNCSNCGQELAPEAKFCSNCGAPVGSGASAGDTPRESNRERERREDFERAWGGSARSNQPSEPTPDPSAPRDEPGYGGGFADRKPDWEIQRERMRTQSDDEWSMPDLGPPQRRRRRTWLWALLGLIAFVVIACCVFGWWITATDSGIEWFDGVATQAAQEIQRATEEAATPVP